MTVFLDTGFILAAYNSTDKNHKAATELLVEIENQAYGTIVISDYVFDELVTLCRARLSDVEKAKEIGKTILNSKIEIIQITNEIFIKAWEIFKQRDNLSFTDCTTTALMNKNGIKYIATFDSGFKQFENSIRVLC